MMKQPKQQKLFEEEDVPETKTKGFYNKYDLISYLIKSIRIGDKTRAIEIMWAMLSEKIPELYIARKLVHFASEDSIGSEAFLYAKGVHDFIKDNGSEINSLSRLILSLCDSPKFRQSEDEHYRELKRIEIRERIKKNYTKGVKPFEVPGYVYDQYTSIGKRLQKQGGVIDERVSGVLRGGYAMRALRLQYGRLELEKSNVSFPTNEHIQYCMDNHISLDEYLTKSKFSLDVIVEQKS